MENFRSSTFLELKSPILCVLFLLLLLYDLPSTKFRFFIVLHYWALNRQMSSIEDNLDGTF